MQQLLGLAAVLAAGAVAMSWEALSRAGRLPPGETTGLAAGRRIIPRGARARPRAMAVTPVPVADRASSGARPRPGEAAVPTVLAVRVEREDGTPVAGAEMLAAYEGAPGVTCTKSGLSDAAGRFAVSGVGPDGAFWVRAKLGDDYAARGGTVPEARGGEVVVVLDTRTLRIRVEGPDGDPVAHAWCSVEWPNSDVSALFGVAYEAVDCVIDLPAQRALSDGETASIDVHAYGYAGAWIRCARRQPASDTIVVRLVRLARVQGRCVDERGVPIPSARVSIAGRSGDWRTGPDGTFEALGRADDEEVVLVAATDDLVPACVPSRPRGDRNDVGDIVLRPGLSASGVLRDASGAPIPHELVGVVPEDGSPWDLWVRTDAEGRFEFRGLPACSLPAYAANHGSGGGPGHPVGRVFAGETGIVLTLAPPSRR